MYGNYNQMNSSHQERYYHSTQTNFNHSHLCFPNAFPTPLPPHSPYSNIDYNVNIEHEVLPPPLPAEHHQPPPSTLEFDASSDRDLANGNFSHIHPLISNLKHARKSNPSPLTTRLQSSLRYILPEVKRNKPSSSVLKIISRALQSPGKRNDPVTSSSSLTSSPFRSPAVQSPAKEDRISENPNEGTQSIETPRKRVVGKLELGAEFVVGENEVSSEPHFQILSKNQEEKEDTYLQNLQNKSVSGDTVFEQDLQERGVNNLKSSSQSQVPSFASEGHEPTSRLTLKTVPPFVLSRIPILNKDSPLGESDADCKMFCSTDSLPNSPEDKRSETVSKGTNQIEKQQIQLPPFSTQLEYKPVVLNLLSQKSPSKFSHFCNNENDIKFTSSRQTEVSKLEPSASVQRGTVKKLKHASCNNVDVDEDTVRLQMVGKSLRTQSTYSSDEKSKTATKDIFVCESNALVAEVSEADPFTSMPRSVSPALLEVHIKNQLSDGDYVCQSLPIKVSKTLQDITPNSSICNITESCGAMNSADTSSHSTLIEQTDCNASMKSNGDETQPKQLQDSRENANSGEQRLSTGTRNMKMGESHHRSDKGNPEGDCSENQHRKKRKMFPVIRSKKASAFLIENCTSLPQAERTEIAALGREIKDKATNLYGKRSVASSSPLSVVGCQKTSTTISKTGSKGKVVNEPEETNVQESIMVKEGNREICVSEMKCEGIFELGGKEKCTSQCTGIESTFEDCSEVTETGKTEILENTYGVFSKENIIPITKKGDKEKIILPVAAQLSERANTDMVTKSEGTFAPELVGHNKPSFSKAAAFVPEKNCIQSKGSENIVMSVPVMDSVKTSEPKLGNNEGSTLLPKAGTYIAEEGNKGISVPEIEKEEALSVSKVETCMHGKEYIKLATLKAEMVGEDIASVVPEIEREKISVSLQEMKCKEVIHLVGEGSEEAEKCVIQSRLPLLKIECKEENDKQIEKNILHETAACMRSEAKFPLSAVDKSGTAVLLELKEQDTVILLPVNAILHPRNKLSNDIQVPSVQKDLMTVLPMQVSENISQDDIIPRKSKSNEKKLSVTSSSEVEMVPHLEPISPSGNKENWPVKIADSSVLEHLTSSELNVGSTQSQPLNESSVALNSVPAKSAWEEQVSTTEAKKLNLGSEPERSGIVKTLGLAVSIDKELDSSQLTDLQSQHQGTKNHCDLSAVIKAKGVNMSDTKPTVDVSTSYGIRSRRNDTFENCVIDKCRLVPKSPKKSVIYESIALKQFQTSENVIKLSNSEILQNSHSTYVKNCDKLVTHVSSKHIKRLDPSTSNHQGLDFDTTEVTKVKSDETHPNNIKSKEVCKYMKSAMPDEPMYHRGTKRGAFKKQNCHMLSDSLKNLCLNASALLNGKWLVLFRLTSACFLYKFAWTGIAFCIVLSESVSHPLVVWCCLNPVQLLEAGESNSSCIVYIRHTSGVKVSSKHVRLTLFFNFSEINE
jgi:hypothetical protein